MATKTIDLQDVMDRLPKEKDLVLTYPHEVHDNMMFESSFKPQYVHSVVFTINTRTNSPSFAAGQSGKKVGEVARGPNVIGIEDGTLGRAMTGGALLGTAAASVKDGIAKVLGGLLAAKAVDFVAGEGTSAELIKKGGEKAEEIFNNIASYAGKVNPVIKTDKIIRLYTPQSPQEEYAAGWSEVEFGLMGGLAKSGKSLIEQIQGAINGDDEASRERAVRLLTGMGGITQAAGFNFRLQDAVELQTGKIPNPYKEQLFKGMNFRTFAYQFKFIPKSQEEFNSAKEIINTFRAHMHPERTDDFFIMYPSQFSIEYQYKGQRNEFLTKIADCALVNMKVDYGSGGALTTFKGTLGAPTEITMTLQFKELELLTRDHFDGYEKGANDNAQESGAKDNAAESDENKQKIDENAQEEDNVTETGSKTPATETEAERKERFIAQYNERKEEIGAELETLRNENGTIDAENYERHNELVREIETINSQINALGGSTRADGQKSKLTVFGD